LSFCRSSPAFNPNQAPVVSNPYQGGPQYPYYDYNGSLQYFYLSEEEEMDVPECGENEMYSADDGECASCPEGTLPDAN
jgi:hypothetical protein